jgi:hypothetical protein
MANAAVPGQPQPDRHTVTGKSGPDAHVSVPSIRFVSPWVFFLDGGSPSAHWRRLKQAA